MTRSNERWLAVRFAYALVFLVPMQLAVAAGPVYKQEGERGTVYSDRPAHLGATPIRNRVAPSRGPAGYDAAVLRAETDLLALERRYAENRVPRRIAIYDPPRGGVQQAEIDRSSQQYSSEKQRQAYQAAAEEQKKQAQRRNAELQLQREEQENLRRSQAQLERERRYLKELESNRGMKF